MSGYRILVTGWRGWPDTERSAVTSTLTFWAERVYGRTLTIVHGGCPRGVDRLADDWARERGFRVDVYPADWSLGKKAGIVRNLAMIADGADLCVAFPGPDSKGAVHCLTEAFKAGMPTFVYPFKALTDEYRWRRPAAVS